ncbi:Phosphomethylpyrimidine kinase-domain-containing protein [Epithele typhae]|uniref:Phosphomethylpyrimidine kinase-domain-containing protein n=1 Tax=Epithele typhae TaxID=378194 RepID=UPI0020077B16|nr:Phosphomethylpyrimidine kinase-domain-containing protein [Epithele typhae]KAH9914528.1 Phosphomethylpyrimidine kinase-domain-containing protein [Epithele typhae]
MASHPPVALTIAGSDPSGGAGIQADLKTFTVHGCYGMAVITALTAQNTQGVQAVHPSPPEFVAQQLRAVLEDSNVHALKTGMLYDAATTRAVAQTLRAHYFSSPDPLLEPPRAGRLQLVIDPVALSTSGHTLLTPDALEVLISELLPLAALVTPNVPEAALLLACAHPHDPPPVITTLEDMVSAALALRGLGPFTALVKGGHVALTWADVRRVLGARPSVEVVQDSFLDDNMEILRANEPGGTRWDRGSGPVVVDVMCGGTLEIITLFVRPKIESTSTHGTGCTLSAAIAANMANGLTVWEATRRATVFTHLGIETAFPVGLGNGPINHLHSLSKRLVPPKTLNNRHPLTRILIRSANSTWKEYVEHEFVKQLARGTLKKECFLHFIKQDYLYLKYYARAYGLLIAKSATYSSIQSATQTIINILTEIATHTAFCAQWGITEADLASTPESPSTTAYGAYLLDVGLQGDGAKLVMALAACLLGYGEVGLWLRKEAARPASWVVLEGNPYLRWIEDYSGEAYQGAVRLGLETIETLAVENPPNELQFQEWCAVWERCTRLEKGFWDASLNLL